MTALYNVTGTGTTYRFLNSTAGSDLIYRNSTNYTGGIDVATSGSVYNTITPSIIYTPTSASTSAGTMYNPYASTNVTSTTLEVDGTITCGRNSDLFGLDLFYNNSVFYNDSVDSLSYDLTQKNPKEALRFRIRSNLNISRLGREALGVPKNIPENEIVAIETLREMITEAELRKYLKFGFVLVPGKSGKTYQVFRNRSHTKVWHNGEVIEEVCVRIDRGAVKVPETDNVIAFKQMIETDEEEFRKSGNIYRFKQRAA